MSGSEHSAEDRTEAPTQKRLEQAREEGQLPISRDLTTLASLTGAALGAVTFVPMIAERMAEQSATLLGVLDQIRVTDGTGMAGPVMGVVFSAAMLFGAIAVPAAACSVGCTLLQTQFYIGGAPIRFQASRISPASGLSRILSQRNLLDFLKSCGRLAILSMLVWWAVGRTPANVIAIFNMDATWLLPTAREQVQSFVRPLMMALAGFAVLDVFLVRHQHTKSMRMTREQVRLELRQTEGDPIVKAKLRRMREMRSRRRMMAKVKSAAVVITNPTHYAVALSYDNTGAPKVVAKGADFVAARIREEAQAHKVPIVANPPLARSLYQVELDREIPAEHYRAVAEVIAYVWKLKNRMGTSGRWP
ncbi:MAG: flagellar type III secretion system protein FlhB [Acetobacteraceae bacterium]|nr:flagellar type III secretion system protein FlhB [Acetobacteraceae bacterium]